MFVSRYTCMESRGKNSLIRDIIPGTGIISDPELYYIYAYMYMCVCVHTQIVFYLSHFYTAHLT